jgi:hypothetical protein
VLALAWQMDSSAHLLASLRAERINEAGLDAERVYWLMVEDPGYGIELVREMLKLSATLRLAVTTEYTHPTE